MVTDIFLDWESYQFRTEEIDAVFHGAVWPQVTLHFYIPPGYLDSSFVITDQHSLHPDMNACPGLFFYIEPSFISGSFKTLSLPLLPPKAQELVLAIPWHLLRLIWIGLCLLCKCNITLVAPHRMCLDFDKHEGKYTDIFVTHFLVWFLWL